MPIFVELSIIVFIATAFAIFMRVLKQPLIVGYILAGIAAGPYFFNVLRSTENIELFSKIGIAILLFIVGLNLSPKVIKEVGKVSLVTGLGQVVFTSVVGYLIAISLGIDKLSAIYVAIALTFSSTIIILKLLSDKGDLNKLYGKIAIGFLLVQDIVATLILIVVSTFGQAGQVDLYVLLILMLMRAVGIGILLYLVSRYVLPHLSRFFASSQELLFLFSIAWGLGLAAILYLSGFSLEIGALAAGVTLSMTPFAHEIGSRMKPLRDFFIVLFFILLGSQMVLEDISGLMVPALLLSLFVLIGNPIIVVILMNLLGYKKRTGFQAGLTVAQISEFSLILMAMGLSVGHVSSQMLSLVTLVGLFTIAGSTYMILYSDKIYPHINGLLNLFEWRKTPNKRLVNFEGGYDVVLFGYNRVGYDFVKVFEKLDKKCLVIDFDPEAIQSMEQDGVSYLYGDAEDVEFLQELDLANIELSISTIPDFKTNLLLAQVIREVNSKAIIISISHDMREATELYDNGASYVVMPHYVGAKHLTDMLKKHGFDRRKFGYEKRKHVNYIKKRGEKEGKGKTGEVASRVFVN